jgi:hypothetical protein
VRTTCRNEAKLGKHLRRAMRIYGASSRYPSNEDQLYGALASPD